MVHMKKPDAALGTFHNGITCPASVFSACAADLGLDEKTARKIACGSGAGMLRIGNICGAVSGAIMVIGLRYGMAENGDDTATMKTRALTQQFVRECTKKNGSVNCTGLPGHNLNDQAGSMPPQTPACSGQNARHTCGMPPISLKESSEGVFDEPISA
jgi:C_GCAxxG_C_C family probable redox protein